MTGEADGTAAPAWARRVAMALAVFVVAALAAGAWVAYVAVTTSLESEHTLHATYFAVALVEDFVATHHRWPADWDDLERHPRPPDARWYRDWPDDADELRRRVAIDFDADPESVARQPPMEFTAIRPIGPYYEHRHGGCVASLQETVRESLVPRFGR